MKPDPCVQMVRAWRDRTPWGPVQRLFRRPLEASFVYARTPQDRLEEAVTRELVYLCDRAEAALTSLEEGTAAVIVGEARRLLAEARRIGQFPRAEFDALARSGNGDAGATAARAVVQRHADAHERFRKRLRWLLEPEVTRREMPDLDPERDADQLWNFVKYDFRVEWLHVAWGNANKRIVQALTATTFFHATGKAERVPIERAEDTLAHYYFFHNWGEDSYHGRAAIESMNTIHGRYYIHNDAIKYVLLNGGFTVLDGLALMAHRPLTDKERLGYFHATVNMGRAMNIQGLTHSWDEMYGWFHDLNRAFADYHPLKARMWQSIQDNFDRMLGSPPYQAFFRQRLELFAMDDTYLSAIGRRRPNRLVSRAFRTFLKRMRTVRASLPPEPYVESLQRFLTHPDGADVHRIGDSERAATLPAVCPFSGKTLPNHGFPAGQVPLVPGDTPDEPPLPTLTWEEVRKHNRPDDLWVVFNGYVHDVSSFARNHPGGLDILRKNVGRDMSRTYEKAHTELTKVFALNFRIGKIAGDASMPRHDTQVQAQA
jgi:hypothetical protein